MNVPQDMTGQRFGRLVVTGLSEHKMGKRKRALYYCDCDCGNKGIEVCGENLRAGRTNSCGCLQKERARNASRKYNSYDLSGEYGIGWTSNTDKEFYFDLEDYDKIKDYCWLELQNGYIASRSKGRVFTYLHRLIMNARDGDIVDHKEHNLCDNRKKYLRIGNQSLNMMNASMRKDNTSEITGVSFDRSTNNWISELYVNKKKIYLGSFANKNDAIEVRRKAEEQYFNDWSYKNSVGVYNNETL